MPAPLYTAIATSTGDGRAGGRAVTDDGLLDVTVTAAVAQPSHE
jgi:osmotically inducible protein OsmC